jgi:hypothetical protein
LLGSQLHLCHWGLQSRLFPLIRSYSSIRAGVMANFIHWGRSTALTSLGIFSGRMGRIICVPEPGVPVQKYSYVEAGRTIDFCLGGIQDILTMLGRQVVNLSGSIQLMWLDPVVAEVRCRRVL